MKKILFISLFLLIFSGCYKNLDNLDSLKVQPNKFINHSQSGKYLSANYSIFNGDVFNANKILKSGENNLPTASIVQEQLWSQFHDDCQQHEIQSRMMTKNIEEQWHNWTIKFHSLEQQLK